MMAKSERDKLAAEAIAIRERIHDLDAAERKKVNRPLRGKCFKYRNSYGSGDGWWLYVKVNGVDEDGNLDCLTFEETTLHIITIEPAHKKYYGLDANYKPITEDEFLTAWNALRVRIDNAL